MFGSYLVLLTIVVFDRLIKNQRAYTVNQLLAVVLTKMFLDKDSEANFLKVGTTYLLIFSICAGGYAIWWEYDVFWKLL